MNDITARKQAEERLLASEEALRVIFNSSHDTILIHDLDVKIITIRDITARRRVEEEIDILNTHLASHVTELEAGNRVFEAFNYTVSHDLRSLLTCIYSYCDLLQCQFCESLGEQYLGYVREINSAAEKMGQLIDTLLEFSSLSNCEIRREEIDLTEIAKGVAAQLRRADPTRQVRFTILKG